MNHKRKRFAGLLVGIAVGGILWNLPLQGLAPDGRRCLAMTLCAIVWWAFEVAPVGFTSCALLLGYILLLNPALAPPQTVFKLWTSSMAYLIIGGFLIAAAVKNSGIGKRFALLCLGRFVKSYQHAVIACYALSYALSLIIPQSFPRAFLIMGVMGFIVEKSGMEKAAAENLGLAVFASQIGAGMFLLTGESSLNFTLLEQLPIEARPSWMAWFVAMGLPAVLLGAMMCAVQLKMYRGPRTFSFDSRAAKEELEKMGPVTTAEKKTAFWLIAAVLLWMTDQLHGIDLGWVSLGIAVMMAMPVIGDVVTVRDWSEINIGTLLFLTACVAIGGVGGSTGMNQYLAELLLPKELQGGLLAFTAVVVVTCVVLHLAMGSILAIFALVTPALLSFAESMGISATLVGCVIYLVTACQWVFPYQNLNITMGLGGDTGGYTSADSIRFGLLCTVPVGICLLVSLGWWKLIGLA